MPYAHFDRVHGMPPDKRPTEMKQMAADPSLPPGSRTDPGEGAPALRVENLSKSFDANLALAGLDLTIEPGEVHAMVGENGSGKSTLIKILSGYHTPDPGGTVFIGDQPLRFGLPEYSYDLGCRFVHQDLGLIGSMSVLDNLLMGSSYPTRFGTISSKAALADSRRALAAAGVDVDPRKKVSNLGAADRTRVAVARALKDDGKRPPRLLVLDEPTATLPSNDVDYLLHTVQVVAASGVAILYVTHHVGEIFRIANRVTVLRDGGRVGTWPVAELNREVLIERMIGRKLAAANRADNVHRPAELAPALEVHGLRTEQLNGFSMSVAKGEIVGIAGLAGSGRDSVLGTIFGARSRAAGRVIIAGREVVPNRPDLSVENGIAFLPADRKLHGGFMELSARVNFTLADLKPFSRRLRLRKKDESLEARQWFRKLMVRPEGALESSLASFSGGNQQKILFGKWLRLGLPVFLLDEPTQGVDVGAKAELHAHLISAAKEGTGIVVSSSDVDELVQLCHRVLVIRDGRLIRGLHGAEKSPEVITRTMQSVHTARVPAAPTGR
jgi:ribose transport system ATP-binding protein